MPDIQKVSIALTAEQISQLKDAVETGEYATTSEAVRDAVRDWQRRRELHGQDVERLRALWIEGKGSGPASKADLKAVKAEAKKRLAAAVGQKVRRAG